MRLLAIILVISSFQLFSQTLLNTPKAVDLQLEYLKKDKDLKNASIGFIAIDVATGDVISEHNADMGLVPASVQKAITTATALEVLGTGKRFYTRLEYTGEIDSLGILHGNIYIKGGGDPALGSKYYKKMYGDFISNWADSIQALGIKTIEGEIIGDASIFPLPVVPGSWMWSDVGNYFGAHASGLTIFDNTFEISFSSGPNDKDSTYIDSLIPHQPNMYFDNKVKASNLNKDNAYIYGAPFSNYRIAHGSIPKGKKDFRVKGSIPDPAWYAAYCLSNQLDSLGITCDNEPTTFRIREMNGITDTLERIEITKISSPTVSAIVKQTNRTSNNLFAEHLLKQLGVNRYQYGDTWSGTSAVEKFWASKGIDTKGMYINDGCGLSRMNAITVRQIASIMKYMNTSKNKKEFLNSLPTSGKSGTMSSFARGTIATGKIHAKTGSMTRVRSYAGYVDAANGKTYAFAIIANNYNCSSYKMKKKIEKLLIALVSS